MSSIARTHRRASLFASSMFGIAALTGLGGAGGALVLQPGVAVAAAQACTGSPGAPTVVAGAQAITCDTSSTSLGYSGSGGDQSLERYERRGTSRQVAGSMRRPTPPTFQ